MLTSQVIAPARRPWATVAGLFFALVSPFLEYLLFRGLYGPTQSLTRTALGISVHWVNFFVVVLIVVSAEGNPLASIGVRPLRGSTIPLGLAAGVIFTVVTGALASLLKLNSDAIYVGYLQSLPFVVRVLLVVTAGVFEETLYRGYALERLASLCGSKWLAAIVTLALFTVMHVPAVGWTHLLPVAIMGSLVTLLYLWKRNLVVNAVAHVTVDAIGLLVAPLFSH